MEVPSGDRLLSSVRSELRVTVSASDDGIQYWCRARHPAIIAKNDHSVVDSVTLAVLREWQLLAVKLYYVSDSYNVLLL